MFITADLGGPGIQWSVGVGVDSRASFIASLPLGSSIKFIIFHIYLTPSKKTALKSLFNALFVNLIYTINKKVSHSPCSSSPLSTLTNLLPLY